MEISFNEIQSWDRFESLTSSYFEALKATNPNIIDVASHKSGVGSDGGRDVLVNVQMDDGITTFSRTWVVQCKFSSTSRTVSKKSICEVNIPSLIHEYGANGYLLVSNVLLSSRLTDQFENLQSNCKLGYQYSFWDRDDYLQRILTVPTIWPAYFPNYNRSLEQLEKKAGIA